MRIPFLGRHQPFSCAFSNFLIVDKTLTSHRNSRAQRQAENLGNFPNLLPAASYMLPDEVEGEADEAGD
jgi:hypothetical protein